LDELSSAQTIINILQNELLVSNASTSSCAEDQFRTEGPGSNPNTEVWTLAASNNNIVKSQKCDKLVRAGLHLHRLATVPTANRFSPFFNLQGVLVKHCGIQKRSECASTQRVHKTTNHQSKVNKISTVVNGIPDSYRKFPSTPYNKEETLNVKWHQAEMRKTQIAESLNKAKYKVLIIGDSHARNCATIMQDNFSIDYKFSSFVKPGALMSEITKIAREELNSLKSDALVVLWGGANDISKNNTKETLNLLFEFVNRNKN